MTRLLFVPLAVSCMLPLAACDKGGGSAVAVEPVAEATYPAAIAFDDFHAQAARRKENPVSDDFRAAVADFSYQTAAAVLDGHTNGCFTPLSLYYALAIAACGAAGDTQTQLLALLGVEDITVLAEQAGNLFRLLYADDDYKQLRLANSLWLADEVNGVRITYNEAFMDSAVADFYSSLFRVDFSDEATGRAMGDWVAQQTKGLLSPVLAVDPALVLVILNTLSYRNEWQDAFSAAETAADTFTLADGTALTTDFMRLTQRAQPYKRGNGYTQARLRLKGEDKMIFVLPDEGVTVVDLLSSADSLRDLFEPGGGDQDRADIHWRLPKFSYDASYQLVATLQSLGVQEPFRATADFSALCEAPVAISNLRQEIHIAIDENGLAAASYTSLMIAVTSLPEEAPRTVEMNLNRPFLYAITDTSGTPLFIGVCADPTR